MCRIARYAFLGIDLFLNAVCDHVFYDVNTNSNNRRLAVFQIVIQVLTFFSILLLMFDTYPCVLGGLRRVLLSPELAAHMVPALVGLLRCGLYRASQGQQQITFRVGFCDEKG